MLGLFGTLDLGARSLATQQQGSEIAGQNLANVNNPAYARQRLVIQTSTPLDTPIGQEGTGADAIAIQQVRDSLLDGQITAETSVSGSLNAQQQALEDIQANLGEQLDGSAGSQATSSTGGTLSSNGLAAGLTNLFNAFQSLSTDPASLSQRQVLLQQAQSLAAQFNQVAGRLAGARNTLNQSVQNGVDQTNQDLADIASLNKQIIIAQAGGGSANDLVDLRQQKIEELSGLTSVTTTTQANGGMDVTIGGVTIVSGVSTLDSLQTYDAGGGQLLVRAQTAGTPLTLTGGSIQGNIDVRDGALATLQSGINNLAGQLISHVNTIHASGYDLNGGTGQNFFSGTDAATIGVNSALLADPSKVQAAGQPGATGDNQTVLALAQLASNKISGLNNQTFSQSYAASVAGLGQSLASVNDQVSTQSAVSKMLSKQRESVSGVSLDEEMTSLMQFQKAYQASAELISTINNMLQTVVTMKTA